MKASIYTIGHSNRTLANFLRLLKAHGIKQVLDVRSIPQSRHNPQFGRLELARALRARSIGYRWVPKLGGRRHAKKISPNSGWRSAAFRGYADYMATASFAQGLNIAASKPTALMCAEAVPWRCHRSLIADALTKKNRTVRHITGLGATRIHRPTPFLRVRRGMLLYPP